MQSSLPLWPQAASVAAAAEVEGACARLYAPAEPSPYALPEEPQAPVLWWVLALLLPRPALRLLPLRALYAPRPNRRTGVGLPPALLAAALDDPRLKEKGVLVHAWRKREVPRIRPWKEVCLEAEVVTALAARSRRGAGATQGLPLNTSSSSPRPDRGETATEGRVGGERVEAL